MKRILSVIIVFVLMLSIVSCQNGRKSAENNVKKLMETVKKGDFSALNYNKEATGVLEAFGGAYKKLSYKINKTTQVDKNKVLVNITIKYPDLSEAEKIFKGKILKEGQKLSQSSKKSDEEIKKLSIQLLKEAINEKLNDSNLKYLEETFDIVYTKQNNNWEMEGNNPQFTKAMFFNYPI